MNDAEILKIVGQIAGIGGLSLGVFLLLFRDIIRKNIFPKLPAAEAYKLLRLIAIAIWSIAVIGILAWVFTSTLSPGPTNSINISNTSNSKIVVVVGVQVDRELISSIASENDASSEEMRGRIKILELKLSLTQKQLQDLAMKAREKGSSADDIVTSFANTLSQIYAKRQLNAKYLDGPINDTELKQEYEIAQLEIKNEERRQPTSHIQTPFLERPSVSLIDAVLEWMALKKPDPYPFIPQFWLANQNGEWVNIAENKTSIKLVYFSYTRSRCRSGIDVLKYAKLYFSRMGDIRSYFITLDPEYDSSKRLQDFAVQNQLPMQLLRNDPAAKFSKAMKSPSRKIFLKDGSYEIDHGETVFIFSNENEFIGTISGGEYPEVTGTKIENVVTGKWPVRAGNNTSGYFSIAQSAHASEALSMRINGFANSLNSGSFRKCKARQN